MVTDVRRLGEGLHAARVVGQTGDVEGAGDAAGGQHQVVVLLRHHLVGDLAHHADLGGRVHPDRAAGDDVGAAQRAPQRDGHRLRCEHTGRHVRQQRQVELVAERGDQGDLRLRRGELALQPARALQSGEAAAHDQDPGSFHRASLTVQVVPPRVVAPGAVPSRRGPRWARRWRCGCGGASAVVRVMADAGRGRLRVAAAAVPGYCPPRSHGAAGAATGATRSGERVGRHPPRAYAR